MEENRIIALHAFPVWLPQTQNWMYQQVRHLPPDIECHVVCDETVNLDQFGLKYVHALKDSSYWRYIRHKVLKKILARPNPTYLIEQTRALNARIVHAHFGPQGWEYLPVKEKLGVRFVATFYGFDVSQLPQSQPHWHGRYQQLFAKTDGVLCEGPHMAQSIMKLGCPPEKIHVHHLGVAVDDIAYRPRVWNPGEPLRVLIAGSFREKKGIPYALQALSLLQNDIPLEVTIIGDAPRWQRHPQERHKILEIIQAGQLEPKVRLLGYQPHSVLFDEAYRHHVFLSPSVTASDGDTEGGAPVSIIEMAATGMPIVSTTHCDIPEVIRHGETGLLAPERDVGSLRDHLRWLTANPDQWRAMVQAGRKHIELEYDARKQGDRLAAYYHGLA